MCLTVQLAMICTAAKKDRNDGFDVDFLRWFSVILRYRAAKPYLFFRGPTESCTSGNPSRHPLRSLYVGALISSTPGHGASIGSSTT
jgi:hypothetical protein